MPHSIHIAISARALEPVKRSLMRVIKALLFINALLDPFVAKAQFKKHTVQQLLTIYEKSNEDSNRVRSLLQLDSVYLYILPDNAVILDSAVLMATQAQALSRKLGFEKGSYEASFLLANAYAEKNDMASAQAVAAKASRELQVKIFVMIGERYMYRPGELKTNLDSAYIFMAKGKALSELSGSAQLLYQSLSSLGKYFFITGQTTQAKACFMRMINDSHNAGNIEQEAYWWDQMGNFMPDNDSTYNEEIAAFTNALRLYRKSGNKSGARHMMFNIAYVNELHKKINLAEKGYLEALNMSIELGDTVLFGQYSSLSQLSLAIGNYNNSLSYAMAAVKNINSLSITNQKGYVYYNMAEAYRALGKTDESLQWYYSALDNLVGEKTQYLFAIAGHIVHAMVEKGNVKDALNFIDHFTSENKPVRFSDKAIVAGAKAGCFNALRHYAEAEQYYLQMIAFDRQATDHQKTNINVEYMGSSMNSSDAEYAVGCFYFERGNYPLAEKYLKLALTDGTFAPQMSHIRDVHSMLFKVDSAQGNYAAAIDHVQMAQKLHDSIFNEAKGRQIEELQIKYKTEKREQELKIARANEQLQSREIKETIRSRRFAYLLTAALLILLSLLFSRYRLKKKSNRILLSQQEKIHSQNAALKDLNKTQQKLLSEKEWLVKEIHHRVKNNLQIILSLLNTQASHLDEGDARMAIQESRNRMQVISLLHQRLYQAETSGTVDMQVYIREVVSYLKESFEDSNFLNFDVQTDPVSLDISDAVSIGLILNEAITNCIKYAFPTKRPAKIVVNLKNEGAGHWQLCIADNGVGMAIPPTPSLINSFGIQLMQTLSEQLDGTMKIESKQGTIIRISFRQQRAAFEHDTNENELKIDG